MEESVNPLYASAIINAIRETDKKCPHCGKTLKYIEKHPGQFYKCKHCSKRFMERGREARR